MPDVVFLPLQAGDGLRVNASRNENLRLHATCPKGLGKNGAEQLSFECMRADVWIGDRFWVGHAADDQGGKARRSIGFTITLNERANRSPSDPFNGARTPPDLGVIGFFAPCPGVKRLPCLRVGWVRQIDAATIEYSRSIGRRGQQYRRSPT